VPEVSGLISQILLALNFCRYVYNICNFESPDFLQILIQISVFEAWLRLGRAAQGNLISSPSQRGVIGSEAGIENKAASKKVYTICNKNTPKPIGIGVFVSSNKKTEQLSNLSLNLILKNGDITFFPMLNNYRLSILIPWKINGRLYFLALLFSFVILHKHKSIKTKRLAK
jgi:hypothetical protein